MKPTKSWLRAVRGASSSVLFLTHRGVTAGHEVAEPPPYYAVPPMEPSQSKDAPLQPSLNSGDAARRDAVGGKRADHADRDSTISAVLAHLVGW